MKRKCKHIDIADKAYIKREIEKCMKNKSSKAWKRNDVKEYWASHNNDINSIVDELHNELATRTVNYPPSHIRVKRDRASGKERVLTIDHIKLQYFNYIAFDALEELASRIGYYQLACQKRKGCIFGALTIKRWLNDKSIRYAIKADIRKCYPSITHENMMDWLKRHVKNDDLLYLIGEILNCTDEGLPIGSYLSIRLCGLYLSDLYHYIGNSHFKSRRGKRYNICRHVLFFLDDIYIFGTNARDMHALMRDTMEYAEGMGLTIKPTWHIINLNPDDARCHVDTMGYRIYRDHISMRRRDYVKAKKSIRKFKRNSTVRNARSLVSYFGMFCMPTDSFRFCKKYNALKQFNIARKVISRYDKSTVYA